MNRFTYINISNNYFTADEIRKYSHPQLKSFEKEFKLLDEHIESDISRIDNTTAPVVTHMVRNGWM